VIQEFLLYRRFLVLLDCRRSVILAGQGKMRLLKIFCG
jgi:hypothetical protein